MAVVTVSVEKYINRNSSSIAIIGGADDPTAAFIAGELLKPHKEEITEPSFQYIDEDNEKENEITDQIFQEENIMEYKWDSFFKFNELNTYFEVHVAGMEGECFEYNIYFEDGVDESRVNEISEAINQWSSQYDEDDYLGYIDITLSGESVFVYLDLGSIEDCDRSIYGIVESIKDVKGIKQVIVNESMAGMDDFDFDM